MCRTKQGQREAANHLSSFCQQVKSLDLSGGRAWRAITCCWSHARRSRESVGMSVLLRAKGGRGRWWRSCVNLQRTHRSMAGVLYYLKPLPKYCSVQKKCFQWFRPTEILFHCRVFCTICHISWSLALLLQHGKWQSTFCAASILPVSFKCSICLKQHQYRMKSNTLTGKKLSVFELICSVFLFLAWDFPTSFYTLINCSQP